MREYQGSLAGEQITLAATFGASIKLAKEVGDPLEIAREANLEVYMMERGLTYHPRWKFTVENVPKILYIGMKEAGSNKTLEQVQELVFDTGFPAARDIALDYLAIIVGPAPETRQEKADSAEDKKEGN